MRKVIGVFVFFCILVVSVSVANRQFLKPENLRNQGRWIGENGVVALGQGLVIITGGIDLSVGSVIGLVATVTPMLVTQAGLPSPVAIAVVLAMTLLIGTRVAEVATLPEVVAQHRNQGAAGELVGGEVAPDDWVDADEREQPAGDATDDDIARRAVRVTQAAGHD